MHNFSGKKEKPTPPARTCLPGEPLDRSWTPGQPLNSYWTSHFGRTSILLTNLARFGSICLHFALAWRSYPPLLLLRIGGNKHKRRNFIKSACYKGPRTVGYFIKSPCYKGPRAVGYFIKSACYKYGSRILERGQRNEADTSWGFLYINTI